MKQTLAASFFKLIVFAGFILFVVIAVRSAVMRQSGKGDLFTSYYITPEKNKKKVYFIGTSRTMRAVNDSMLNALMPQLHFVNAGMGYGTFNGTAIIAQKIMEQAPASTLFIELTLANGRTPDHFSMIADAGTTFTALQNRAQHASFTELRNIHLPFAENYIYDYIYLKPYLKLLTGNASASDYFGRVKRYETLTQQTNTFLSSTDLHQLHEPCDTIPDIYTQIIKQLLQTAAATHSEIIFYLPVCMDMQVEKNRLLCVYNSLPQQNRLPYSTAFLSEISKPQNLADGIHFNVNGAAIFTNYLYEFIKNGFEVQPYEK